jgi:hypothetical protein
MTSRFTILLLSIASFANAADFCVGPSATGSGNGSDWTNQMQWSSFTPVRGNTYYLANGSYGSKTLSTAVNGTQLITIRKATVANHGPSDGWSDTYAQQFAGTGQITITTHYWVIDGATRDETDWFDESAYGMKITRSGHTDIGIKAAVNGQVEVNNITISNVAIILPFFNDTGTAKGISTENNSDPVVTSENILISRVLVRGGNQHFFLRDSSDNIVEYCASELTGGSNDHHGNTVNLYYNANRTVIRYNKFRDQWNIHGTGGTSVISTAYTDDHEIYGNLFIRCYGANAVIGFADDTGEDIQVYNNTFVDCTGPNNGINLNNGGGAGNIARNNLWVECTNPSITVNTSSDNTTAGATSLFVDYDNGDYRLANNTLAGYTLSSPYDVDLLGVTRGSGGQDWSRGAYQFAIESEPEPEPGATLMVGTMTVGTLIKQ